METVKKLLPFVALFYAGAGWYGFLLNLTAENSALLHFFDALSRLQLGVVSDSRMIMVLLTPVVSIVLLIGLVRFYQKKMGLLDRPLLFGLSFFAINGIFSLPTRLDFLLGLSNRYPMKAPIISYVLVILGFVAMVLVFWALIDRNRKLQKKRFPERKRSFEKPYLEMYFRKVTPKLGWKRLFNFLFDWFFIFVLVLPSLMNVLDLLGVHRYQWTPRFAILLSAFLYFLIMEAFSGQTLGKMLTKTVAQFNGKDAFSGALVRSLCRFIPFEPFSFIPHAGWGWHDKFSETYVERLGEKDYTESLEELESYSS